MDIKIGVQIRFNEERLLEDLEKALSEGKLEEVLSYKVSRYVLSVKAKRSSDPALEDVQHRSPVTNNIPEPAEARKELAQRLQMPVDELMPHVPEPRLVVRIYNVLKNNNVHRVWQLGQLDPRSQIKNFGTSSRESLQSALSAAGFPSHLALWGDQDLIKQCQQIFEAEQEKDLQ